VTSSSGRRDAVGASGSGSDPVIAGTALLLWLLLALFVVYPLAMLLVRVLTDHGSFSTAGLATLLTDRHQIAALWNSLLLAALVGAVGTVLGFVFALVAARGALPRAVMTAIDASVLLPLVSPPSSRARTSSPSTPPMPAPTASASWTGGWRRY